MRFRTTRSRDQQTVDTQTEGRLGQGVPELLSLNLRGYSYP